MKVTFAILSALAATVAAQSSDTVSATQSGACTPHGDHWHCPSGVSEPTTPPPALPASASMTPAPSASTMTMSHSHDDHDDHDEDDGDHDHAVSASTCMPHGNHWHCPSGVAEPTTKPAVTVTSSGAAGSAAGATGSVGGASSAGPSAAQNTGAAGRMEMGAGVVIAAVGAMML